MTYPLPDIQPVPVSVHESQRSLAVTHAVQVGDWEIYLLENGSVSAVPAPMTERSLAIHEDLARRTSERAERQLAAA